MNLEAEKLYIELRKNAGSYPDWTGEHKADVLEFMKKNELTKMFIDMLADLSPKVDKENISQEVYSESQKESLDTFKHYYGFSTDMEKDPLNGLIRFIQTELYSKEEIEVLEKVVFGSLPKIFSIDPDTGELEAERIPNGIAVKAANDTYLVGLTTQLTKTIYDFSVISCATSVFPELRFNIPIVKIPDSYRALIQTRWINGEIPPTWNMHYMPEDLFKDPEWFFRSVLSNNLIIYFFLFHEIEHILCNHLDLKVEQKYQANDVEIDLTHKILENEFEADAKATERICKLAEWFLGQIGELGDAKNLATYNLARLSTFFDFLFVLETHSPSSASSHPPALARKAKIDELLFKSNLPIDKKTFELISSSFNSLMQSISKRINV